MLAPNAGPSSGCWAKDSSTTSPHNDSRPTTQIPFSPETGPVSRPRKSPVGNDRGASYRRLRTCRLGVAAVSFDESDARSCSASNSGRFVASVSVRRPDVGALDRGSRHRNDPRSVAHRYPSPPWRSRSEWRGLVVRCQAARVVGIHVDPRRGVASRQSGSVGPTCPTTSLTWASTAESRWRSSASGRSVRGPFRGRARHLHGWSRRQI